MMLWNVAGGPMREVILQKLEENHDLPPLPEIALRLQQMIGDPKTNARAIAKLIEVDPVLAGRILKMANSAYYSRSTMQITTLPVAVTKIGLNMISRLVISLKMTDLFTGSTVIDSNTFWKHCLAVAILTQSLSRLTDAPREDQDIAYLGGLMHDIGIMVFGFVIPAEYAAFVEKIQEIEEPLEKLEEEEFGIAHPELGSFFVKKYWEVDDRIVRAVGTHHNEMEGDDLFLYSDLVNIANSICNNFEITNGVSVFPEILRDTSWDAVGIPLSQVETIIEEIDTVHSQAKELLGGAE